MIAIINGQIVRDPPKQVTHHHDEYKQYRHQTQRTEHKADLVQPYDHNGKPNPEFIKIYPERSIDYFGKDNIRKYGNNV